MREIGLGMDEYVYGKDGRSGIPGEASKSKERGS